MLYVFCMCVYFGLKLRYMNLISPHLPASGGSDGKESVCNAGDLGSIPGLGRFPRRRAWQPTPVSLSRESPWMEEPGGLQSTGLQRVGHD